MKSKVVALAIVSLFLVSLIVWDEYQTGLENSKVPDNLFAKDFPLEKIDGIEYIDPNADSYEGKESIHVKLKKADSGWEVVNPVSEKADEGVVEGLLKVITEYKIEKKIPATENELSKFGLKTPVREIVFLIKGENYMKVQVGENAPIGYSVYSSHSNEPGHVFIGSQHLNTATIKSLFDFRNKKIEVSDFEKVKRVEVVRQSETFQFGKNKDSWLASKRGDEFNVETAEVSDLISAIKNLNVTKFEQKSLYKDSKLSSAPFLSVSVVSDMGVKDYSFKKVGADVFYFDGPVLKKVSDGFFKYFEKTFVDYRSKKIVQIKKLDVANLILNGTEFVKRHGHWEKDGEEHAGHHHHGDEEGSVTSVIDSFLVDLEFSKISRFIEKPLAGKKILSVKLSSHEKTSEEFEVFEMKGDNKEVLIKSKRFPQHGVVSSNLFEKIVSKL